MTVRIESSFQSMHKEAAMKITDIAMNQGYEMHNMTPSEMTSRSTIWACMDAELENNSARNRTARMDVRVC
jgi:hypothetical protein